MKPLSPFGTPDFHEAFGNVFEQLKRTDFNKFSAACFKELGKIGKMASREQQDKAFQRSVRILAERGWFISLWHTPLRDMCRVAKWYTDGEIKAADEAMSQHFSECLDEIERTLVKGFPRRETILRRAFEAHRNSNYELSVPVMLSQADGMGCEIFKVWSIYAERERPKLKNFVEAEIERELLPAHLALIGSLLPINASRVERLRYPNAMNRNSVLHGENISYANSIDAHKAVSWIQYVGSFRTDLWLLRKRHQNQGQA